MVLQTVVNAEISLEPCWLFLLPSLNSLNFPRWRKVCKIQGRKTSQRPMKIEFNEVETQVKMRDQRENSARPLAPGTWSPSIISINACLLNCMMNQTFTWKMLGIHHFHPFKNGVSLGFQVILSKVGGWSSCFIHRGSGYLATGYM